MTRKKHSWHRPRWQNFLCLSRPCAVFFLVLLVSLASASSICASQLNINTAQEAELTSLPYIGRARAQAIISHRRQHGPFLHPEELLAVDSIGPKSLAAILPHITLTSPSDQEEPTSHTVTDGRFMLLADDHYFPVLLNFIKTAEQRIDMAMYLFKTTTSKKNRPAQLVDELIKASNRGIQVQVVLEKSGYNDSLNRENSKVAARLEKHRIKVRFDSPARTSHSKLVIIDRRFCFVGSHNMSHSALAFNHEMSLLIDNQKMAGELTEYIDAIQ